MIVCVGRRSAKGVTKLVIDIHTHAYPPNIAKKIAEKMERSSGSRVKVDGTPDGLVASMKRAGVDYSVFLPVATTPRQVGRLNAQAVQFMERYKEHGLMAFGAVHPDTEHPKEVMRAVQKAGMKGVKIHPDYQDTYFDDIRYMRIIDTAAELGLFVLVHAGVDEVYPNEIHCDVPRIVKVLEMLKCSHLILAHMGGWYMWDDVKKYLCGAPVYFDTAFSLNGTVNVENNGIFGSMLDDTQFVEIVRAHGAEKILFGSDTPWSSQRKNVEWIRGCSLTEAEKAMILGGNAAGMLFVNGNGG